MRLVFLAVHNRIKLLLFQTCGHHTDRLYSRSSVIEILAWKCVYVCLRLCFVDGSRCARKTLRCGLVLDVAQRSNGSEIVHHHTDRLYSRSLVIEILARKCVYVCVCVFDYVLSMVQGVLAKRCGVDWCSTWPREATDPKEFICFWPTRILKFYARFALLEIHLQGHKTQTFQTQPQTYYLHSCSAWPSFKQQDPSPDRVTLIVTSYGIAGLCARNARNRNARLPSASVTLQGT